MKDVPGLPAQDPFLTFNSAMTGTNGTFLGIDNIGMLALVLHEDSPCSVLRRIADVNQDSDRHRPLKAGDSLQPSKDVLAEVPTVDGLERLHEVEERVELGREVEGGDSVGLAAVVAVTDKAQADLQK